MAFHWRDGIYFERTYNHVRIFKKPPMNGTPFVEDIAIIPDSEWCSIIAAVSKQGETSEQFQQAKEFHGVS